MQYLFDLGTGPTVRATFNSDHHAMTHAAGMTSPHGVRVWRGTGVADWHAAWKIVGTVSPRRVR